MTIKRQLEQLLIGKELRATTLLLCYASAAGAVNKMNELEVSLKFGLQQNIVNELELYEALLQLYLFAGFPAAIESLTILNLVLGRNQNHNSKFEYNVELFRNRGENLCKEVYTTVYKKMRLRLQHISPEIDEWMIIEGYGKTLSREGLSAKTRELVTATSLAALGWENQLFSHLRGAILVGSTPDECFELLEVLELLCEHDKVNKTKILIERVAESIK
ncbi:MAG: carboxymuconolactone decarboxylase family protein [Bacteroidetes bacterium]|nr:carboxymuconolactone decarboxylase family protein [Bacteroidota bacterium]